MTSDKSQKRAVRARMAKTGERFTTARLYHLDLHRQTEPADGLPPRLAEPGMTDAAIKRGSGRTWDEWFAVLDAWGATSRPHVDIARHVAEVHGVDGWWAQNVTVGFERARGMRAINQRVDGFSANVSRTYPTSVERLFAAAVKTPDPRLRLRTASSPRSARFDLLADGTRVTATFTSRSPEKASIAFQHLGLADQAAVEQSRAMLKSVLDGIAARLQ